MKLSIGTVGPPSVILATSMGLLYFYMEPPPTPAGPKPISLEVTEAMLNPKLEPLPLRNPFHLSREADMKPQGSGSVMATSPDPWAVRERGPADPIHTAKDGKETKGATASPPPSGKVLALTTQLLQWTESLRKRTEQARLVQSDLKAKVEGKANLSATSINARGKIAIINNRSYAEGEAIDWAAGIAGPIVVAEIRAASVLLRSKGAQHEVLFPHSSKPTAAVPTVAANVTKKAKSVRKSTTSAATKPR